jgi:hypothetical protein
MLTPDDLRKIADDLDTAKAREALAKKKRQDDEERHLHEAFLAQDVAADAMERLTTVLRRAAENGRREVQVMTFPAAWCKDGGRAVNAGDPDWPASLDGFAARGHAWFRTHLEPAGYRLHARVLSYPDGNLGDVGLFIAW